MKSGGFQSMKLSKPTIRGIYKKGYKQPTPIQRKTIPVILEGKDVVAMARTGSGKTAAFLIPIIEKLKSHQTEKGVRALILSPTRELALQTYSFTKEFAHFTDLKCQTILGGDSMERQFAKIHENPDILIATPGRLLHIAIEMDLKFSKVEIVIFDEADRLFEMGFKEQLNEILSRLPRKRQTLLFSATLPQMIIDFTKAGLVDPVLIRLDTEKTISENLKLVQLGCRLEDKLAVLLYLLKFVIKPNEQTIVFLPTRHHIEYTKEILDHCSIKSTYLYSSLDSEARKNHIRNFYLKKANVLLVTDLAARGVDIPMLDNVINYNFPSRPKLFVHRVGRTARAGRSGTAYSMLCNDELPYLFSLSLFLGSSFKVANIILTVEDSQDEFETIFGKVPQNVIDEENEMIEKLHLQNSDLDSMKKVCNSAYKQYLKTREIPDAESVRKMKRLLENEKIGIHPLLIKSSLIQSSENKIDELKVENERRGMLDSIRNYKPNATIFELGKTKGSEAREVMKLKRQASEKSLNKKNSLIDLLSRKENFKDEDFYLSYQSGNAHFEKGLQLSQTFDAQLKEAILDFDGDERGQITKNKNQLKWDRKRKKFIQPGSDEPTKKKIRTESGNWISASYKSGSYEKWKKKAKLTNQDSADNEQEFDDDNENTSYGNDAKNNKNKKGQQGTKISNKKHETPKKKGRQQQKVQKNQKQNKFKSKKSKQFSGKRGSKFTKSKK